MGKASRRNRNRKAITVDTHDTQPPSDDYLAFIAYHGGERALEMSAQSVAFWNQQPAATRHAFRTAKANNEHLKSVASSLKSPVAAALVHPKLLPMWCHVNAQYLAVNTKHTQCVCFTGFECKCGSVLRLELHSVNRDGQGNLVDFTTDYNGDTAKCCIVIAEDATWERVCQLTKIVKGAYYYGDTSRCTCGMPDATGGHSKLDLDELQRCMHA